MSNLAFRGPLDDDARGPTAPDLQELVREHGGYEKITAPAWAAFDRANAEYQARRRERLRQEQAHIPSKHGRRRPNKT